MPVGRMQHSRRPDDLLHARAEAVCVGERPRRESPRAVHRVGPAVVCIVHVDGRPRRAGHRGPTGVLAGQDGRGGEA